MKKYLVLAAIVLLFTGCATSNNISPDRSSEQAIPVAMQAAAPESSVEIAPPRSPSVKTARKRSIKNKVINAEVQKAAESDEAPAKAQYSLEMRVNDEDDITKLLKTNYDQNFDIPIVFNDAVKYYIKWFSEDKKKVFTNWLKSSRLYVPIIREILRENDMPEDLVYLAMIESGFNPKAYSTAKASGPWQFIYSTGGRFGLEVDYWVDERRDPQKSTVAAAKYLKFLFDQFGCWYLAAASYNAGEGRIGRLTQKHNTMDFWELHKYNTLPKETRAYVPQLIAAAIIAKDPGKFGFGNITYDPPIRFTEVKVPSATPITAIAKASSVDIDLVRTYNPEILRGITPPGKNEYIVKLPSQVNADLFGEQLQAELTNMPSISSITAYKIKKKDNLAKILKRYNVDQRDLVICNSSDNTIRLKPGTMIAIPRFSGNVQKHVALANEMETEVPVVLPKTRIRTGNEKPVRTVSAKRAVRHEDTEDSSPKERTVRPAKAFHIVKKGETLSEISDRYGIDESSLRAANNLKGKRVYTNMKLRLVSHAEQRKAETKKTSAGPARGKTVRIHTVKKGETLSSISDKYGVDVDDLKAANRIKGNKINKNAKLKIVKEG
ncbi:MAG: lytic transglycosylase domain-containing protein [Syntrophorhabdaceae bacterium]